MPRQTRAAARAQEAEPDIKIATDDTATDGPGPAISQKNNSNRPALLELTESSVNEIEAPIDETSNRDLVKELDQPTKGTKRGGKGTRKAKGTKANKREDDHSTDSSEKAESQHELSQNVNDAKPIEQAMSSGEVSPVQEMDNLVCDASHQTWQYDGLDHSDNQQQISESNVSNRCVPEILENGEPVSLTTDEPLDQQEMETPLSPKAAALQTEDNSADISLVAQNLQSIFDKPGSHPGDEEPMMAEAAGTPLPPSPVKKVAKSRSQGSTLKSAAPPRTSKDTLGMKRGKKQETSNTLGTTKASPIVPRKSFAGSRATVTAKKPVKDEKSNSANKTQQSTQQSRDNELKKRSEIAALNTPPKVAKSTKAPTKSNFSLPSEALREKLKAQREERQRRQEEIANSMAEKKQQEGPTIRPPRKSSGIANKPALERKTSIAKAETLQPIENVKPAVLAAQKRASTTLRARQPSMSGSIRRSSQAVVKKRDAPAVRENKAATLRRTGSLSAANVGKTRTSIQPSKSSEEPKKKTEEGLKIATPKKEEKAFDKAEAAKRARAEAAERGRAASREWAEKKRKELEARKLASSQKAQTEAAEDAKENVDPAMIVAA